MIKRCFGGLAVAIAAVACLGVGVASANNLDNRTATNYAKKIAKYDKILIDGTDVSNSFRNFGYSSEHAEVDVSGFSATGTDPIPPVESRGGVP